MVCLFLCLNSSFSKPANSPGPLARDWQQWTFDESTERAYKHVLNLQVDEAHLLIPQPESAQQHYVTALAEALELLITEDGEKYRVYEERFNQRLERKTKTIMPDDLFLQAEIRLQWAFVYLKFGHEFDAALNLRQAYLTVKEIKKKFPGFQAINKTSGLLEIIIGSVPQKYHWILSLLNIEGSIKTGFEELESIHLTESTFAFETSLIHALIQGFLLQKPDLAVKEIEKQLGKHPLNRLALFLGSAIALKNAQSEAALIMLGTLSERSEGLPLYFAEYMKGEINLYKGEYLNAISSYRWFINHYKGQNGVKDAYYKIGLCYWLNGNANDARETFKQAKTSGKEASESDKYAARSLAEAELPHIELTKARYATDGGYYARAHDILASLSPPDLPTKRDQVEYFYRKARLAHKQNELALAKDLYHQSIDLNDNEPWYFAPNACLQLGYIVLSEGDNVMAKNYFTRALSYNKHEYKNSIDSKAKSAIAQIKRK